MATDPSQWQHVVTEENPADLYTRGPTPKELSGSSLWWHGPTWLLSEDKANWPKMDFGNRPTTGEMAIKVHYRNISRKRRTYSRHEGSVWRKDCGQTNTQIGPTLVNEQLELLQSTRKI